MVFNNFETTNIISKATSQRTLLNDEAGKLVENTNNKQPSINSDVGSIIDNPKKAPINVQAVMKSGSVPTTTIRTSATDTNKKL